MNPNEDTTPKAPNLGSSSVLKKVLLALLVLIVFFGVLAIILEVNHHRATVPLKPAAVSITSTGFVPSTVYIKVGQAVIWTNKDTKNHQVASDPYPLDNGLTTLNSRQPIVSGSSFSYVFNRTGTYTYHDNLNPYTLKGTVIVKAN